MLLTLALLACSGGSSDAVPPPQSSLTYPAAVLQSTWPVQVAAPARVQELLGNPGWQAYYEKNYAAALAAFGPSGPATARLHAEIAGLYRQAALLAANAIVQTYKPEERREGDPDEVQYVYAVARLVTAGPQAARPEFGRLSASASPELLAADRAWAARLDAGAQGWWPLSEDPALFPLPAVAPGALPELRPAPHYTVPEKPVGDTPPLNVGLADPTALLQAALWHEQAAIAAGGQELADAVLAPYRLPGESLGLASDGVEDLPIEVFFMGTWMGPADLALLASLRVPEDAVNKLKAQASVSPYAMSSVHCLKPDSRVDADCVQDAAVALSQQIEAAMAVAAGAEAADHRLFSEYTKPGALRVAAAVAEAQGETRLAGELWLIARDRSQGAVADPGFMLALAAWDAGQRNPSRAQDLLHDQVDRLPGLQAARVPLDALHIRVSRDAGPSIPGH